MAPTGVDDAPPPSYEAAVGSSSSAPKRTARNGIPPPHRRSMEDERRPLPKGWVRSFDPTHAHHFYVNTAAEPPRSIWHHPYDDDQYLNTLDSAERERIQSLTKSPNRKDIEAESTDEDEDHKSGPSSNLQQAGPSNAGKPSLGRRWKDKLTQSTHEERVADRQRRAEEERQAYDAHLAFRQAMVQAMQTGQPQLIAKDRDGRDVYIEPPNGARPPSGARGINPYSHGPYTDPNARFIRAPQPAYYNRPYGGGYGGGYGLPIAGGLAGGLLLGGLLGGF
ncbi:MAG: hypothetical protein M1828_005934 [Chrysothrix sp. TS-e1954]|nr:MAG: hypothetical protein M1828_005934 [Chrysothrix sp. TS-e1954]